MKNSWQVKKIEIINSVFKPELIFDLGPKFNGQGFNLALNSLGLFLPSEVGLSFKRRTYLENRLAYDYVFTSQNITIEGGVKLEELEVILSGLFGVSTVFDLIHKLPKRFIAKGKNELVIKFVLEDSNGEGFEYRRVHVISEKGEVEATKDALIIDKYNSHSFNHNFFSIHSRAIFDTDETEKANQEINKFITDEFNILYAKEIDSRNYINIATIGDIVSFLDKTQYKTWSKSNYKEVGKMVLTENIYAQIEIITNDNSSKQDKATAYLNLVTMFVKNIMIEQIEWDPIKILTNSQISNKGK